MSIFRNNLRAFDSAVPSNTRSTNSTFIHRTGAVFLVGLLLFGADSARAVPVPYNVLINPGAETGDLTGWNVSSTGYIYVVSTNGTIPSTTNNYLTHSGKYMFQTFDITADSAYIYQDYAAIAGSQWSADCWAICYASNYFDSAIAYMSVAFYDTNGNVVLDDPINPDPGTFGVYGSDILDPTADKVFVCCWNYIITPPPDVWMFLPATNFYYGYTPANTNGAPGINIEYGYQLPTTSTNLTAPPGTAFVRYQLEYDNWSTDGGAVYWDDCVLAKLTWSDPDITNPQPTAVTCYCGDPASFTVYAVRQLKANIEILEYQWQKNGTNLPPTPGGDIVGNTTNTSLVFSACQGSDAGMYSCLVTAIKTNVTPWVTNGTIRTVPVPLTVLLLSPIQIADVLGPNAGFESAPIWSPWIPFNGAYFVCATNVYDSTTNTVNVFDGNWCAMVGENGDRDNGFLQRVTVTPGTYWKAGGWAYISSYNDFAGGNTCRIQIWFTGSLGNRVPGTPVYESFKIYGLAYTNAGMTYCCIDQSSPNYDICGLYHDQLPRDQWCYLPVTNIVNNDGIGLQDDLPIDTLTNGIFMVPTNTTPPVAGINQVYEYCPVSTDVMTNGNGTVGAPEYLGVATDAVYWDDMMLVQIVPAQFLTASLNGTNINLSFGAGAGLNYTVFYKTNLTDITWLSLTNVQAPSWWQNDTDSCGGSISYYPITVTNSITTQSRFYRVSVQ